MGSRRRFLGWAGLAALGLFAAAAGQPARRSGPSGPVTLFLCGDVMTGRGIDQVLPHPSDPRLYEPYVTSAADYVALAERASGPIPAPVDYDYIWGDALEVLRRRAPDARIINLETAVTRSGDAWPGKGIHYRMHPDNVPCLTAAGVDCAVVANNHVLDWGYRGFDETLETLHRAAIKTAGAGRTLEEARAPAVLEVPGARVLVLAFGTESSGIPRAWAANGPGVNRLADLSDRTADSIARQILAVKQARDVAIASIHWGGNWGYDVPAEHRRFARRLIDAGVDVVHGHSSHHPMGIEVYRQRPILYGCGDFLNDYEGITGHGQFRADLTLMYFPQLDPADGRLIAFTLVPMQIRRFRLAAAAESDRRWLAETLDRESRKLGCRVEMGQEGALNLRWA